MSKVIIATYYNNEYYKVPIEWDLKDISFKWGIMYYKNEEITVPKYNMEHDMKRPDAIEEDNIDNYDEFFDCEEE
jgi:hypothetical protein